MLCSGRTPNIRSNKLPSGLIRLIGETDAASAARLNLIRSVALIEHISAARSAIQVAAADRVSIGGIEHAHVSPIDERYRPLAYLVLVADISTKRAILVGAAAGIRFAVHKQAAVRILRVQIIGPVANIQVSEHTHKVEAKTVHVVLAHPVFQRIPYHPAYHRHATVQRSSRTRDIVREKVPVRNPA